jgi:5-methylcytosine-specific restriction endonuclease McrA
MTKFIKSSICKEHPELNGKRYAAQHHCPLCVKETHKRFNEQLKATQDPLYFAKERIRGLAYAKANPGKVNARTAKRRASKLKATPPWSDLEEIKLAYAICSRVTKETKIPHEVDHIIPLKGEFVCGLHVPYNLQLLTEKENRSKGVRHG